MAIAGSCRRVVRRNATSRDLHCVSNNSLISHRCLIDSGGHVNLCRWRVLVPVNKPSASPKQVDVSRCKLLLIRMEIVHIVIGLNMHTSDEQKGRLKSGLRE